MKEIIADIFRNTLGLEAPVLDIKKLHGDASYRTYSRAFLADGSTYIIMQMPVGKASASEEITNYKGEHKELPFINVARFLSSCEIPVPKILHYDENGRILILEDLGDELMAKKAVSPNKDEQLSIYKRAVDLLCTLQKKTDERPKTECIALSRSFDTTLLNWEFDHFLEYGIEARLNLKMADSDRKIFTDETRKISSAIEKLSYGFTHRDFQSRNIIIQDEKLYLIDFQDALLGPKAYDLVSLTRDSYVKLSPSVVGELIKYYCKISGHDEKKIRREYHLITIQRKLKDAGRFIYIDRVKKNPNFLQYIPASLEYVKNAFKNTDGCKHLFEMLKKYVPEWK